MPGTTVAAAAPGHENDRPALAWCHTSGGSGAGPVAHSYGYDGDSRPVSQTLANYTAPGSSTPANSLSTTAYDGDGLVTSVTDGLSYTTHYTYDQLGDQVTAKAPDNSVTTTAYDADGEPLSVTGPTGAVSQATYDYLGRPVTSTQIERYTGAGTTPYTANYTYGDGNGAGGGGGWLSKVTTPAGVSTQFSYASVCHASRQPGRQTRPRPAIPRHRPGRPGRLWRPGGPGERAGTGA
jgi:YD repeat-containing protein